MPKHIDRGAHHARISFLGAWVSATIRQAERYRKALDELVDLKERQEASFGKYDLMEATGTVMTEAHLLVNAAYQVMKWGELAVDEGEYDRSTTEELLHLLRNCTEHLDKATLTAEEAQGSANAAWSIMKLPGGRLSLEIRLGADDPKVFDLIAVDEIERICWLWSELVVDYHEPELDGYAQAQIDAYRDK